MNKSTPENKNLKHSNKEPDLRKAPKSKNKIGVDKKLMSAAVESEGIIKIENEGEICDIPNSENKFGASSKKSDIEELGSWIE